MPNLSDIWVFRIIAFDNLKSDLSNGLYAKLNAPESPDRIVIGNNEIIEERDNRLVTCYPGSVVNDYVPFYFSVRTPMLFNIHTGHGVKQLNQENMIYLCIPLLDLATQDFQWCFTDGNAAKRITNYYNDLNDINQIDWRSIKSNDFRFDNADGDEDRIRKKHSEFLVRDYIPCNKIKGLAVCNKKIKASVKDVIDELQMDTEVKVRKNFYFF